MFRKLESDLQSSKKRYAELIEQCDSLKKGREESVSSTSSFALCRLSITFQWFSYHKIPIYQEERGEALDELKTIEQKYNELKVSSSSFDLHCNGKRSQFSQSIS